jgi:branched-chain amino acid transport system permease protein
MMRWVKIAVVALLVAFLLAAPSLLNTFYLRVVAEIMIYGLLAMAVNLMSGYTGLAPFGQAGIFGTAAYMVGFLVVKAGVDQVYVTVPAGIMAATVLAMIFGAIAIRTSGLYFLMITLAQGMIIWGLAYRLDKITGAENGLRGISRPDVLRAFPTYYYVVLIVVALTAAAMYVVIKSPFGLTLQGIREGERRMKALGYNVLLHKWLAFVLAGFFSGIAGVLYVYYNNFVSPATVEFARSAEELLMVILGGSGTFVGPMIGSIIITSVRHQVSLFTDRWLMILGVIYVFTIMVAPGGIVRGAQQLTDWVRYRRMSSLAAKPQEAPEGVSMKGGE